MKALTFIEDELVSKLDSFIEQFEDKPNNIISILHYAQELCGYLPPELQTYIAESVGMPTAKINGIVSFYSFFNENKMGKYTVDVCMGTACFVKESAAVLKEFKTLLEVNLDGLSKDGVFNVNSIRCVGACGIGPVVRVNKEIYGHVKKEDVKGIIEKYLMEEKYEKDRFIG